MNQWIVTEQDGEVIDMEVYLEMSTLSTNDKLVGFPNYKLSIFSSGGLKGSRDEHNPPHLHIIEVNGEFNISVDLYTLEIIEVKNSSTEEGWSKLGLANLYKSLEDWLKRPSYTNKEKTNYIRACEIWEQENETLDRIDYSKLKILS